MTSNGNDYDKIKHCILKILVSDKFQLNYKITQYLWKSLNEKQLKVHFTSIVVLTIVLFNNAIELIFTTL